MRGVDALRLESAYHHPPLGYVGNLRRFSPLPGSAARRVTPPAGYCVRARDAFWKLLIAVIPVKSLRAEYAQRDRVRTLGLACGNLLGALTIEPGKDRQNLGVVSLRNAVAAMEQCRMHAAVPGSDDEVLKTVLKVHLARLNQDDLLDIENGQEIEVDERAWPDPRQRELASHIMRLIAQLNAEATTVPRMVRKLEDLARSISPLTNRPLKGRFFEILSKLPENKRISNFRAARLALAKIPSWHWNRLHDALFRNTSDSDMGYASAKPSGHAVPLNGKREGAWVSARPSWIDRHLDWVRAAIACESARREAPGMVLELREKHPGVFSRDHQVHGLAMAQWLEELLRKDAPEGAEARESDEAKRDRIAPVLNEQLALLGDAAMKMTVARLDSGMLRWMLAYTPGEAVTKMVKAELASRQRSLDWIDGLPVESALQPLQLFDLLVVGESFLGKIPFGNITLSRADELGDEEWVHYMIRQALRSTLDTTLPDQVGEVKTLALDARTVSDDLMAVLMKGRNALRAYGLSLDEAWAQQELTRRAGQTREAIQSSLATLLLHIHEQNPAFLNVLPQWQVIAAALQRYFLLEEALGASVKGDAAGEMTSSLVDACFGTLGATWSDHGRKTSSHVQCLFQAAHDWAGEFFERYPVDGRDMSRARALTGVRAWARFLTDLLRYMNVSPIAPSGDVMPELAQWCRATFPA